MASERDGDTALGVARARFVESLPRKAVELEAAVGLVGASPEALGPRDDLRRRLHALYASAQVFRIRDLAGPLRVAVKSLDEARQRGRALVSEEVDGLGNLARSLPQLAQEREPGRSVRGSRIPSSPGIARTPSSVPGVLSSPGALEGVSGASRGAAPGAAPDADDDPSGGRLPSVWKRTGPLRRRGTRPSIRRPSGVAPHAAAAAFPSAAGGLPAGVRGRSHGDAGAPAPARVLSAAAVCAARVLSASAVRAARVLSAAGVRAARVLSAAAVLAARVLSAAGVRAAAVRAAAVHAAVRAAAVRAAAVRAAAVHAAGFPSSHGLRARDPSDWARRTRGRHECRARGPERGVD